MVCYAGFKKKIWKWKVDTINSPGMHHRETKRFKNIKEQLRDMEDGLNVSNIHPIAIPEEDGGNGRGAIFEEITAENFPDLKTDLDPST